MTHTSKIPTKIAFSFCALFCLSSPFVFSQQVDTDWIQRYNGPGNGDDKAVTIAVDPGDNMYVTADSEELVTITVNNVNLAPVLNTIGAKSVNENQFLQFRVSATDPDGTVPTLSADSLPTGATFVDSLNGAGSFAWMPSFTQAGNYNVTFIASDGTLADSEVVAITVNNVNRAPFFFNLIGNISTYENQYLRFRVFATDPDLTTPNFFAVDLPSGATLIDSLNGQGWFSWTPSFIQSGIYNVTFIASDGSLADSEAVVITVNNFNPAPILAAIGDKLVTEGQLLQFRVSASDADGTVPNHSAIDVPSGAVFVDSLNGAGSFSWTPSFTQGGIYNVTFIASDGVLADSEIVTITVNESDNEAPVLAPIGAQSAKENQELAFNISATDPNLTTPLLSAVNLPSGATFVDSLNGRGHFAWTPALNQAGTYNVTFIARDAVLADTEVVTVTVLMNFGDAFAAKVDYGTGSGPHSVYAADFNGDGKPDLAVANNFSSTLSVFKNNGDGTFAAKVDYGTRSDPHSVFAADFNGDGKPDLAVANYPDVVGNSMGSTVSILKNNGDGTFAAKVDYGTGYGPYSVFAADFNGDGKPDLAVANHIGNTVSVLKNNGDGTFAAKVDYGTGYGPHSVFAADFNGDGKPDLAVANNNSSTVSVLENNGDGTFAAKVDYWTGGSPGYPGSVFASDLDGDGKPDLAVANGGYTVSVFKNNGDGTFAAKVDYGAGNPPSSVFAADLDRDGKPDLAVVNYYSNTISLLKNNGNGTFAFPVDYGAGGGPFSVFATDLDGDGDFDLAVTNLVSSTVSVLKNLSCAFYAKGDMDGDGILTLADVVLMLNCVFLGAGVCPLTLADVNCSGNLTPTDVVLELNRVFFGALFPC